MKKVILLLQFICVGNFLCAQIPDFIELKAENGHSLVLKYKSIDPKDIAKFNIWAGAGWNADGTYDFLGASFFLYKKNIIHLRVGTELKMDGTLLLINSSKVKTLNQNIDYKDGSFYVGKIPASKSLYAGLRYGAGHGFVINSQERNSFSHVRTGIGLYSSKFSRWTNVSKDKDIISSNRIGLHFDVIYYFNYNVLKSSYMYDPKATWNKRPNELGFSINFEFLNSTFNNYNRGGRYLLGVATIPFEGRFNVFPQAGIFVDFGQYKDDRKYGKNKK